MNGKLYIVPTPIGNLEDITFRAINVLKQVKLILAEDTRTSGKLLFHYSIQTPMQAYHMHNEHFITDKFVEQIKSGSDIAIICDAGTPGISDPSYLIVKACIENKITVECLPGATAFVPALVVSGFPINQFLFIGFLPLKKGRKTALENLVSLNKTIVLYESPHKIKKTITELELYFGKETQVVICREISKKFEEIIRGNLDQVKEIVNNKTLKGELVVVIDFCKK